MFLLVVPWSTGRVDGGKGSLLKRKYRRVDQRGVMVIHAANLKSLQSKVPDLKSIRDVGEPGYSQLTPNRNAPRHAVQIVEVKGSVHTTKLSS